jgi:ubiquinone/menaquinone biosynthesis C-methylase UbiE
MSPWYEDSFGSEYLELYAHRDEEEARSDIEAVVRLMDPPREEPLLDLCCGACRHILVLREMGFTRIVGLDLSEELLEAGACELANEEVTASRRPCPGVELVQSDMREIPYEAYFATVLSLFTSFGYFESDRENVKVLSGVFRALRPGGKFLIDYLNRDYVIATLVERDEKTVADRHVENVRCLTDACRRVEKTTTVTDSDGNVRQFHESVRMYSRQEMIEMMRAAGFADVACYGSLDGDACSAESRRLILIAEKGTR